MNNLKVGIILAILLFSIAGINHVIAKTDTEKLDEILNDMGLSYDILTTPDMEVWGTEYVSGEQGKIWLQLLDAESQPIVNSTCFITTWFPNNTMMFNQSPMYYLDEGIHQRDFIVPDVTGVYPQTALCSIPRLVANYSLTNYTILSQSTLETGDGEGGIGWFAGWGFDSDGDCSVSSSNSPIGTYHIFCSGYNGFAIRPSYPSNLGIQNVSFWAKFNSLEAGDYYYVEVVDCNTGDWILLNTWDENDDDDIYKYYTYNISGCDSGTLLRFRADAQSNDEGYFDNITITQPEIFGYYEDNTTEYQYIFGSGEIHVSDTVTSSLDDIWKYIIMQDRDNLESNHDYCLDNQTLLKVLTYSKSIDGEVYEFQENQTFPCANGCYEATSGDAECIPSEFNILIIIMVVIIIAIIIVAFTLVKGYW